LVHDAQQALHVVPNLVGDDISLGEVAGRIHERMNGHVLE
jgi:hypothetical protein